MKCKRIEYSGILCYSTAGMDTGTMSKNTKNKKIKRSTLTPPSDNVPHYIAQLETVSWQKGKLKGKQRREKEGGESAEKKKLRFFSPFFQKVTSAAFFFLPNR